MNRRALIIIAVVCIIVAVSGIAVIGAGWLVIDSNDNDSSGKNETISFNSVSEPGENVGLPSEVTDATRPSVEQTTKPFSTKPSATKPSTTNKPASGSEYEYAYAGFNPSVAVVNNEKWYLLLVNRDYILPESFSVKTAAVKGGAQSLDYRVVPYYNDMIAAAEADGISLIPVSGYRSYDRQHTNFERKINYYVNLGYNKAEATRLASEIVLMPGTSEHNAGLAMDFGTNGNYTLDENFAKTDAFKWLSEHAADYGFILRYESDTKHITKITYEPWHWRYVGVKAAKEIKASGVTLEEYLGMA